MKMWAETWKCEPKHENASQNMKTRAKTWKLQNKFQPNPLRNKDFGTKSSFAYSDVFYLMGYIRRTKSPRDSKSCIKLAGWVGLRLALVPWTASLWYRRARRSLNRPQAKMETRFSPWNEKSHKKDIAFLAFFWMMNLNVFECSLRWEVAEVSSFIGLEGIFFQSLTVWNTDEIQLCSCYSWMEVKVPFLYVLKDL